MIIDDVFDAGDYALFGNILNLGFVDDGKHFLGLRFGSRQETGTEAGGGQYGFANSTAGEGV